MKSIGWNVDAAAGNVIQGAGASRTISYVRDG